jgi:hypothetical protein
MVSSDVSSPDDGEVEDPAALEAAIDAIWLACLSQRQERLPRHAKNRRSRFTVVSQAYYTLRDDGDRRLRALGYRGAEAAWILKRPLRRPAVGSQTKSGWWWSNRNHP